MLAQANAVRIPLPDQSIHCAVTSPPYWGLRKYAGEQGEHPLGLEDTPEEYTDRIVEIGRELWRVLRPDGVLWWNHGDCYAGSWGNYGSRDGGQRAQNVSKFDRPGVRPASERPATSRVNLPQGSLLMMPHRVALALQADGWIVRQDLVWFKRNPMPESVNGWRWQRGRKEVGRKQETKKQATSAGAHFMLGEDYPFHDNPIYEYGDDLELRKGSWRHTRAHEYVFMLTKQMGYWSNQEAVREASDPAQEAHNRRYAKNYDNVQRIAGGQPDNVNNAGIHERPGPGGRNPRSVLDVPTAPYKGAHYATFSPNLIAPLIRATCPRWACPVCGQGWAAVVEQRREPIGDSPFGQRRGSQQHGDVIDRDDVPQGRWNLQNKTLGYRPTCEHEHTQEEAVPGIVFDPFVGSGTTVAVAKQLLRRGIGIELSMEYLDHQAKIRTGEGMPSNTLENLPLFADML